MGTSQGFIKCRRFVLLALAVVGCGSDVRARERTDAGPPPREMVNSLGMKFALIPAGEFVMGLPHQARKRTIPRDFPPHRVAITRDFYLGVYEVTQDEYQRVTGLNPSWHGAQGAGAGEVAQGDQPRLPVEQVSWLDAVEFCRLLSVTSAEQAARRSYRLPTEAEWEFACRGGQSTIQPITMVPLGDGKPAKLKPVGSYPANRFGLYDMRENVWEWCSDWFVQGYYRDSPRSDPQGPKAGILRVVRGREWIFMGNDLMIPRDPAPPERTAPNLGFRVVCVHASQ